ncbi:hypothetical protein WJX72_002852 [[Myrmecia] bisecta]|uniref:NADP-dependent oxidoreductase domain-containing protein n=1 Tax=[Myrmecia] bisecta TaxID=41462 RepID=A0AAW1Q8R7_9CHLO
MLFGESTPGDQAARLLHAAADAGINFFDSAEMYPVPQRAATQGASERILGSWLKHRRREDYVIATKATGPSGQMTWIRGGPHRLDATNITAALDGSLRRLQTDYIDLYQLHWPDRYVPMFGDIDYDPSAAYAATLLDEQLEALSAAVSAGKVRQVGLSNETAWGLMECCRLAKMRPRLAKVASLQNAYSLLCRTFDMALAECCHQEGIALLAYSPLAMGLLTGKYLAQDGGPPHARLNRYKGRYAEAESRYGPRPNARAAIEAYVRLAGDSGLSPVELAMRFVLSHPLVASAVIGATSVDQLMQQVHAASQGSLDPGIMARLDEIHQQFPNPTP